jgi:predicted transposase/invertase (TIGR01784 family)
MNIDTLNHQDGTFVEANLRQYFSDLLYKVDINNTEGYIYILYEHKSYYTEKTVLQVLKYIIRIWERKYNKSSKKFPVVLPIVVYHGKNEWRIKNNLSCMIENYDELPTEYLKYIPNFDFELYDLSPESSTTIKGDYKTKIITDMFRAIRMKTKEQFLIFLGDILKRLVKYSKLDHEDSKSLQEFVGLYIIWAREDITEEDIEQVEKEIAIENGGVIMSLGQKLIEKGKIEGKIETAKKMLKARLQIEQIVEFTGLSIEEIEELKKEMKK